METTYLSNRGQNASGGKPRWRGDWPITHWLHKLPDELPERFILNVQELDLEQSDKARAELARVINKGYKYESEAIGGTISFLLWK